MGIRTADNNTRYVSPMAVLVRRAIVDASNPIAALTRLVTKDAGTIPGLTDIAATLIREALQVAAADGSDLRGEVDPEAMVRPAGGRTPGKSSMLQDVEAGRPVEAEAILGQVQAFGRDYGVATPTIDIVCALLRGLDLSIRLARGEAPAKAG